MKHPQELSLGELRKIKKFRTEELTDKQKKALDIQIARLEKDKDQPEVSE